MDVVNLTGQVRQGEGRRVPGAPHLCQQFDQRAGVVKAVLIPS
jgi:hypothetical protein